MESKMSLAGLLRVRKSAYSDTCTWHELGVQKSEGIFWTKLIWPEYFVPIPDEPGNVFARDWLVEHGLHGLLITGDYEESKPYLDSFTSCLDFDCNGIHDTITDRLDSVLWELEKGITQNGEGR